MTDEQNPMTGKARTCVEDDEMRLALALIEKYSRNDVPTLRYFEGEWYLWDGSWNYLSLDQFQALLYLTCKEELIRIAVSGDKPAKVKKFSTAASNAVERALRAFLAIKEVGWIVPRPAQYLAFKNQLLNIDSWVEGRLEVVPNAPAYFDPHALPYPLVEPNGEPTIFLDRLRDQFTENEVQVVQEFGGLCMTTDMSFQKALNIIGPKRSLKSTILKVVENTIGTHNCCTKTFQSFCGEHGMENLPGKTLLSIGDNRNDPRHTTQAIERLLNIIGGDTVDINPKGRKPYSAQLTCKLVILSNRVPEYQDDTGAMEARNIYLETTKSYAANPDPTLLTKILSQQNEITWWFLHGLRRLKQNGKFTQVSNTLRQKFIYKNSPVECFIHENCDVTAKLEDIIPSKPKLYFAFKLWCEEKDVMPLVEEHFYRQLYRAFPNRIRPRLDSVTRRAAGLSGLKMKEGKELPDGDSGGGKGGVKVIRTGGQS